ncbi:hypothetical protein PG999_009461 [Apiospora kogelbergensis]|uniref:Uncharacterized protein n=1 Tax=Apiospora kogelbergensis TaxID=1337665 RepID=A0AAW0QKT3_9PEZI
MSSNPFPTPNESGLVHANHETHRGNAIQQAMGTPTSVTPAKRPDTDTDDVQFISSKPVKRQKVDHPTNNPAVQLLPQPELRPVSQYQQVPQMDYGNTLTTSITAAPIIHGGDPTPSPYGDLPASTSNEASQSHASKQSCKACFQVLQQRAALARAQGLPFFNPNMPLHMLPSGPYHPAFGPQAHPHFMSAMQAGVHQLGPGSSPMVLPMNMQNYNGVMSSPLLPQQYQQHAIQPMPQKPTTTTEQTPETGYDRTVGTGGNRSPQPTDTVAAGPGSPAKRSPGPPSPHPSLLRSNHRKHSPNLIVDVAETCQEKFPFEEVAKRHGTTVEKVADVFGAIIQVPLLRCPKDRRRAGRLAHERVKEYNKTKRELQDTAATSEAAYRQGGGNSSAAYEAGQGMMLQPPAVVRPFDIANALGPTE